MKDLKSKLNVLKGSFEAGIISKEEYEREKNKLESEISEFDKKVEEINQPIENNPKSSENILIIGIAVIILLFGSIIAFSIYNKEEPKTLEDLHVLNLKGKLKPEEGYVYKGVYSFVFFDNVWHTQLKSPKGTRVYSMALRYSPRDVQDIIIEGVLNGEFFNNQTQFYVTFNPVGKDLSYVALAVADFDTHMSKVFEKNPIPACDRNETEICKVKPIVTCDDQDKLVLYVKESDRFRTYYNNNCIVVEGNGLDLVRGVDRILYNLYTIMEQEET